MSFVNDGYFPYWRSVLSHNSSRTQVTLSLETPALSLSLLSLVPAGMCVWDTLWIYNQQSVYRVMSLAMILPLRLLKSPGGRHCVFFMTRISAYLLVMRQPSFDKLIKEKTRKCLKIVFNTHCPLPGLFMIISSLVGKWIWEVLL